MAAGVRVGNALGAGNGKAAKNTVKVALTIIGNYRIFRFTTVSLFQALGQWGRSKKRARDERDPLYLPEPARRTSPSRI